MPGEAKTVPVGVAVGRAELRALLAAARQGEDRNARDRLVRRYLPVVRSIARRHAHGGETLEDLVQVGTIGLIAALDRFDLERGTDFLPFALPYVAGEIKRHLRDRSSTIRIPRRVQALDAEATRRARAPVSLSEDPDAAPAETADLFDVVAARVLVSAGARALDPRERHIVLLHHFGGLSQTEVARLVGISQIHVSRLYRGALEKLRAELGEVA
jgi:RNA polymerase sigma-B factor